MAHESRPSAALGALRAAFPHTLPVLTGFTVLGLAYGVLMASKGYGPGWSLLMSALCFCGSMHFAAIGLLTTAFDPIQALLLSLMVNARHLFYGVSMLKKYKGLGKKRVFLIFALCDETFSLTSSVAPPPGTEEATAALTAFSRIEKSAMPRPWTPQRSVRTLSSLEVTRASKTRSCMPAGMPAPSSRTVVVRRSPSRVVAT